MDHITLKQLRAVAAIGRTRKIVSAARELNLTPPAVTLQLQQLEMRAGSALFDRTSAGLRPTDAGQVMLETAAQIRSLLGACEERLAALKGIAAGRLAVGAVSTAKYFAPRLISAFAKVHPGVEVRLMVGNREDIVELVRGFQVDIAIMGTPPKDLRVAATAFGDHPLVVVAPPDHRLVGRRGIPKADLAEEVFLTREEGSGTRSSMEIYLDGLQPTRSKLRIEMGSNETIKQAVMAGLGLAFISAHTVAAEVESGRLASLDVEGLPVLRNWFIVHHLDKALVPAAAAFTNFLKAEGRNFLPPSHAMSAAAFGSGDAGKGGAPSCLDGTPARPAD